MTKLKILLQSNVIFILFVIFVCFYVVFHTIIKKHESIYTNGQSIIEGYIYNIKNNGSSISFLLKSDEKVQVFLNDTSSNLYEGMYVRIKGSIEDAKNNTIPNTFNYRKYLYNNGVYKILYANKVDILKNPNIMYKFKNRLKQYLEKDETSSVYLKLFIMGSKNDLSTDQYNIYRDNGIAHLLAVSGMHISLLLLVLEKILIRVNSKIKSITIVFILILYAFIANFSVSILRCLIFYILKKINSVFNIRIKDIKLLLIPAAALLLMNPFYIYDVAFLYSHIIVLGILANSRYIKGNYIQKLLIVTLIATIYSLPISISMNYQINITSIVSNLVMVPFVSFIIFPLSIIVLFFPFLTCIYNLFLEFFINLNEYISYISIPIIIPKMPFIIICFYYITCIFSVFKKKFYIIIPLVVLINGSLAKSSNNYIITYFDVGQGDSALIVSPHNRNSVLIDTSGIQNAKSKKSDDIILYLKSIGISKLNSLVITHGDFDHMGEAINLVNNFKVEKVIFNCGPYNELEIELIKVLDKKKIKHYSCIKELNVDKNKLYFLQTKEYDNENDNSNVIYTELNGYKFMFMGDASVTTEKEILNKYNLPNIDVLKVGHHGSRTSSSKEFIDEINPKYSIISVGKKNRYGHPNKEVLENINESKIYRTDQDGSIMFKIKNNKLKTEIYCS
jgi:competence protein ComEC